MSERDIPKRPRIVRKEAWDALTEKQKRMVAFLARTRSELPLYEVRDGAGVTHLSSRELTDLSVKLGGLKAGVRITWRQEGSYTVWWMETVEPKEETT